ncbi:MAG: hypothetical protein RI897_3456 [Verrucomicrobiota bacterium]
MAEGEDGVGPGGDEFLGDVAGVAGIEKGLEDTGVVDFLGVIEFGAAGVAGSMHVSDDIVILADSADHITVHDLDVVDVEEEFHVRRIDFTDEVDTEVDIIAEVAGVAFHGV